VTVGHTLDFKATVTVGRKGTDVYSPSGCDSGRISCVFVASTVLSIEKESTVLSSATALASRPDAGGGPTIRWEGGGLFQDAVDDVPSHCLYPLPAGSGRDVVNHPETRKKR